jgi:hypothetical protein
MENERKVEWDQIRWMEEKNGRLKSFRKEAKAEQREF